MRPAIDRGGREAWSNHAAAPDDRDGRPRQAIGRRSRAEREYSGLKADYDGMLFYDGLGEPGSVVAMGEDGCLARGRAFTWRDWVTWEYDEVLSPSVHTESAQRGFERHLALNREQYCHSFQAWAAPYSTVLDHLEAVLACHPPYASADAPPRSDRFRLQALCDGVEDPRVEPLRRAHQIADRRDRRTEHKE